MKINFGTYTIKNCEVIGELVKAGFTLVVEEDINDSDAFDVEIVKDLPLREVEYEYIECLKEDVMSIVKQ